MDKKNNKILSLIIFLILGVMISCSPKKIVKKVEGDSCKKSTECEDYLVCEANLCRKARLAENENCEKNDDCKKQLVCFKNLCTREINLGDPCDKDKPCKKNLSCYNEKCYDFTKNDFLDMEMLDFASEFKFYIMSDNKSDAIETEHFNKMINWTKDRDMKFVIGLGDHLKKGRGDSFINFIKSNEFYKNNFYPNIADGENEYYGSGQDDWGSGKKLFDEINFTNKKNVTMRENGAEYYALINVNGFNIHIIQLHYPDQPQNDNLAWPADSREYLIKKLNSIDKKDNDIIIVAAHSRGGSWNKILSKEQLDVVMKKVDIAFSATTHFYERITVKDHKNDGTLFLNTGSITHGLLDGGDGYLEVHVLKNPNRIIIEYIDVYAEELKYNNIAWIKYINGEIKEIKKD